MPTQEALAVATDIASGISDGTSTYTGVTSLDHTYVRAGALRPTPSAFMENADAFVGALARRLDELPVVELPSRLNEIFERRDAATLEGALAAGISERQLAAYRTALAEEMRHRFDTIPSTIDPLEVAGISSEQNRQWRENVGEILAPFTGRVLTIDYGVPGIVAKAADEAGIPLAEIDGRLPTKTSYEMGTDRAVKFQRSVPPILLMDGTAADRYDLGTETPNR